MRREGTRKEREEAPLKRLRMASSLVVRKREARSLYCPAGQWKLLYLPERPLVGQLSWTPSGHGVHVLSHGRP